MFINHDIEKDKVMYPHFSHNYTFIVCHKHFDNKFGDISNKVYLTDFKEFSKESGATLVDSVYDSKVFGEITFWDYIYKTIRDDDWACLCAYRRKIYPRIGIQVANPIKFPCTVLQQLAHYHSTIVVDALTKALPKEELAVLNGNLFVPYNIFSAPRQVIGDWLGFVIPRVTQTMQILGCPQDIKGAKEWVKTTDLIKPAQDKNISLDYQSRVGAFISERINTIFWLTRNYGQQYQDVRLLETGQSI
jgi:hypothetical protein